MNTKWIKHSTRNILTEKNKQYILQDDFFFLQSPVKLQAISAITVAIIVTVGVIVSAVILANGDYGRNEACAAQASSQTAKLMDGNMVRIFPSFPSMACTPVVSKGSVNWLNVSLSTHPFETTGGGGGGLVSKGCRSSTQRDVTRHTLLRQAAPPLLSRLSLQKYCNADLFFNRF